jgi:ketosteroid isomerase-like protein
MIEHQNSFLVHQCLQAISTGDTETLRALWAEDIVWQTKGPSPWQGELKGPDEIFDFLAQLGEAGSDGYEIDIEDVMIGEERATIVLNIKASREGRHLDTNFVLLARIVGRRVEEVITIPIDAEHIEDFWKP